APAGREASRLLLVPFDHLGLFALRRLGALGRRAVEDLRREAVGLYVPGIAGLRAIAAERRADADAAASRGEERERQKRTKELVHDLASLFRRQRGFLDAPALRLAARRVAVPERAARKERISGDKCLALDRRNRPDDHAARRAERERREQEHGSHAS